MCPSASGASIDRVVIGLKIDGMKKGRLLKRPYS
ncbi:hypothetical protein M2128_000500 [Polynucleobacter sphagniphilus]|uniref:Uncharacterized protein n=1 Tax=Polynucleobacter sphagniphilus TaxID=1743169 RepID=A0AA43M9K4_9BURK|nr:hypothetical protein [Polynucleobacter sphagniphilus]MDH6155523.1 hypothetical protein [Polynucleobacter sphagniphilus]MDH6249611.1 hypothetical protein [Polynucleobacter sphagniphilus]MDH6299273.1 hypothetical protein [Polynucleobacter sphagniphilus]MDH6301591.1 hypothetical protein [Polynucleobacter sphagniphilus]